MPFLGSLIAAIVLVLAHPPYHLWPLAWVALVPLLLSLQTTKKNFFGVGYLFGCVYFSSMFWWLWYVHPLAPILLTLYLSCYPAFFSFVYIKLTSGVSAVMRIIITACLWTVIEFVRARFLTGFGWASIGHTQYSFLPVIQIASLTATAGVTFVVVLVNAFFAETVNVCRQKKFTQDYWKALILTTVIFAGTLLFGYMQLSGYVKHPPVKIAAIQPNVSQSQKWDTDQWPAIMQKLEDLSRAAARDNVDLIVWPETALPGYGWMDPEILERVYRLAADIDIAILTGLVTYDQTYYNSALLIDPEARKTSQYDKVHLVPFGEFLPLRNVFPFLEKIAPIADFSVGKPKVLAFQQKDGVIRQVGPLICFEDTVEHVSRKMSRQGAQILVNLTNDAWYGHSKAAYLHLQSAVFEAVENHRPMIRSANTGLTAKISAYGKTSVFVAKDGGSLYHGGYEVFLVEPSNQKTFVTKYGDVFTYICFGCILIFVYYRLTLKHD